MFCNLHDIQWNFRTALILGSIIFSPVAFAAPIPSQDSKTVINLSGMENATIDYSLETVTSAIISTNGMNRIEVLNTGIITTTGQEAYGISNKGSLNETNVSGRIKTGSS